MDPNCDCHSEISRDGSGQLNRYLKALDPSYAPVDDRSLEDLLVFAKRYANQIRFYDVAESNASEASGSKPARWREFFRRDLAVITASIAVTDLAQLKKDYDELRTRLDAKPRAGAFGDLFDPILGMAAKIDDWYSLSIPDYPLYADLQLAIASNLKGQMQKIRAYEEGFKYVEANHPLNLDYSALKNKALWGLTGAVNADISIYQGTETDEKILNAALYIDDIFNAFYGFLKGLGEKSDGYMTFALEHYPAHQPHMALFIAFLRLFRLAQEQMNGLTGRMLDFYYKDVLRLTPKPSVPDKVHVVFELAKDVTEYDVAQFTPVKAGKDAAGIEQVYKTDSDLVVNGAKVKELKTIFIEKGEAEVTDVNGVKTTRPVIRKIYARPVAASKDGAGEKFTDPAPKWPTFGQGSTSSANSNLCEVIKAEETLADRKDYARVGIAVASPQLVLQGGKRLIRFGLNLTASGKAVSADFLQRLTDSMRGIEIWLTGGEGWVKVGVDQNGLSSGQVAFLDDFKKNNRLIFPDDSNLASFYYCAVEEGALNIYTYLPVSEQAIIAFDAKKHPGYDFKTGYPVALLLNRPSEEVRIEETVFTSTAIANLTVRTKVGSINPINPAGGGGDLHLDGLKTLILQNEDGLIAAGKPFNPFTAYPGAGRSFYIGSSEIFNKPFSVNDQLAINIDKTSDAEEVIIIGAVPEEGPADDLGPAAIKNDLESYYVKILERRQFLPVTKGAAGSGQTALFTRRELTQNILASSKLTLPRQPLAAVTEWKTDTDKGFIRLDLRLGPNAPTTTLPDRLNLAPSLEIKEISVSYDSTVLLEPALDQFFHVYPFGVVETYLRPFKEEPNRKPVAASATAGFEAADGAKDLLPVAVIPYRPRSLATEFDALDKAKDLLLVDANNLLLPQFNYLSPYAGFYKNGSSAATPAANNAATTGLSLNYSRSKNAVRLLQNAGALAGTSGNPANQYTGVVQQGMLFIGLEKLYPLQSVSLLFQFAEGSAENEDDDPPAVNWSYLTNNEWRPLKAENIVSDGTYGFQTTGIVKIDVPEDATAANTIITGGLTWFCASVDKDADRIPQLIDIVTQAVAATFEDQNNDPSHFDQALAAGSIGKLAVPVAQISKVQQPFASFDGKHKEAGKEFYTRVSERLRHKARAISAWDYEHLVLDRFPSVYKVKCITHTDPNCLCRKKETTISNNTGFGLTYNADGVFTEASEASVQTILGLLKSNNQLKVTITAYAPDGNLPAALARANALKERIVREIGFNAGKITTRTAASGAAGTIEVTLSDAATTVNKQCCGPQIAPGHVLIIPIADLKNRNAANPLQPKTSRRTLLAIEDYLKPRTSPFVHVHAKNPVYEQILVSFKVKFYTGTDKGFYTKKLNDEIVRFLTPWAFDEKAEVAFNQKVYASSVINFIEERPYVDFITDFEMGVCCNECCPPAATPANTSVKATITDSKRGPVPDVDVIVTNNDTLAFTTAKSDDKGIFTSIIGPGVFTLTFSKKGYESKAVTVGKRTDFKITLYRFNEVLQNIDNCRELEQYLQSNPDLNGDIVAAPCTLRSILVSAPQHIIVPYQEPDQPSPCEARKTGRTKTEIEPLTEAPSGNVATVPPVPKKDNPLEEEPKKEERESENAKPIKRPPKPKKPKP